ncbi:DUF6185 family protein [Streptomyces tricolor]|nr:DUF6185 family protein [Streptomyces tricolor]
MWSGREKKPEDVQVQVDPPWQRRLPVTLEESPWITAGIASWWVCASVLIAVAAIRVKRAGSSRCAPDGTAATGGNGGPSAGGGGVGHGPTARYALHAHTPGWAGLSAGVALAPAPVRSRAGFLPRDGRPSLHPCRLGPAPRRPSLEPGPVTDCARRPPLTSRPGRGTSNVARHAPSWPPRVRSRASACW